MIAKTFTLLVVAFLVSLSAEERPWITRNDLLQIGGADQPIVRELVTAMDSGDRSAIESCIQKAMAEGHSEIVSLLLKYPASEYARRAAALALSDMKSADSVRKLLEALDLADVATIGGEASQEDRNETIRILEMSISKATGVITEPDWSRERKRMAYISWLNANTQREGTGFSEKRLQPTLGSPPSEAHKPILKQSITPIAKTVSSDAKSRWMPWVYGFGALALLIGLILFVRRSK